MRCRSAAPPHALLTRETCALYWGSRVPALGGAAAAGLQLTGLALRLLVFRGCSMLKIGGGPKSGSGCARVVTSWADRNRTRARRLASFSNSHLGGWMPVFLPTNPAAPPPVFPTPTESLVGLTGAEGPQG